MNTYNLFLASSAQLADERKALEIEISRINDNFSKRNVHLRLHIWEKFDSANDPIRKQNFYNEQIAKADVFLVVYQSELGAFTREEYEQAQQLFVSQGRPRIYLFKKTTPPDGKPRPENVQNLLDLESLWYTPGKEQWPWEYSHISELIKKMSDDILSLFNNPDHPHFSFHEVRKLSLNSPEMPAGFLGREEELKTIYQKLHSGGKLMLINAEGGIGKTTLAAKYWNEALNNYKHAAWLFCESGIINSLKEIAPQLNIDLSGMDEQQQIQALKQGLHAVQNEFLLVLDNLNNEEDIRLFRQEFEGFHWHVLITSRCQGVLDKEHELAITHLPPPLAKELFERYYHEDTEDFNELLGRVLKAINYHTLLTEVFAKNLSEAAELGEMDLATFLNRLENEGLFLREQSFEIENNEWAAKRKAATTDHILDALYDFGQLTEDQRFLLVNMALLPAEPYTLPFINSLLVNEPDRTARQIRDRMKELVKKGWVNECDRNYRLSPVIQKLVLEKHGLTLGEDSKYLLVRLNYITHSDTDNLKHISLKDAAPYIHPVHNITLYLKSYPGYEIALYNFNAGVYYTNLGDLINARKVHINYGNIYRALLFKRPSMIEYQNGLAISYAKLGDVCYAMGDWENALLNYEECNRLQKKNTESDPYKLSYKNVLAISYERLGDIYFETNQWKRALDNFQECNRLQKENNKISSENLDYKNSLAISYDKLGSVYLSKENWKEALVNYQENNRLQKEINESSPGNLAYKNNLATSHERLGNIYEAQGKPANALAHFHECNRLQKEINEISPENLAYKNSLAISYEKLGSIYMAKEDWENAHNYYQEYHRLLKENYESSPVNIIYKRNLVISYERLGTFYLKMGDGKNALLNYKECKRLQKEINISCSDMIQDRDSLAISYIKLSDVYYLMQDWENAINNCQRGFDIFKEICGSDPGNPTYKTRLAVSYEKMGNICMAMGNRQNALNHYMEYNRLKKETYKSDSQNLNNQSGLANSYYYLGHLYAEEDKALAIENLSRCVELYKELVEKAPKIVHFSNNYNYIKQYLEDLKQ